LREHQVDGLRGGLGEEFGRKKRQTKRIRAGWELKSKEQKWLPWTSGPKCELKLV
jgi:hypothetical protein